MSAYLTNMKLVLPMYMGVILDVVLGRGPDARAPHVYGGDPQRVQHDDSQIKCSPCIWG